MNFSFSDIWNNSLYLRYQIDKVKKIGNLYFYEDKNILTCQNFFEFNINDDELMKLKKYILNYKKVRFSYMNDTITFYKLKEFAKDNNFTFEIIDSWDAPKLNLDSNLTDYFKNNCGSQIKRNYKKYLSYKDKYKFYNSKDYDVLKLWNYVLKIDFDSWKKEEKSDMKSLNREDLQYLPFLLLEKDKSSLVVICDLNDTPLAYSLMFKGADYWFAVKWGASKEGRKKYAGFYCLFNHLEYIYSKEKNLKVDFWGRRNNSYDLLKNDDILRNHIYIYKRED